MFLYYHYNRLQDYLYVRGISGSDKTHRGFPSTLQSFSNFQVIVFWPLNVLFLFIHATLIVLFSAAEGCSFHQKKL